MTAFLVRVRRTSRVPLRLGTTNVSNSGDGSVVDANDPLVKRDMGFFGNRFVVLGPAEAGTEGFFETMDPNDAVSEITNATQVLLLTAIELPKGLVVSSSTYVTGGTAAGTPTHQFGGLYDFDGTTLTKRAASADNTGAVAANSAILNTFTTAWTTTYAGLHWLAWLDVATSACTLVGQKPFNSVVANIDGTKLFGTLAGQSTLPATTTPGALTAVNSIPYVKLA